MRRKCTDSLIHWKKSPSRKPLILQGLRQTGKTWLLRDFGKKYYKNTLYINFETSQIVTDYFSTQASCQDIFLFLEIYSGIPFYPSETLLILDNISCVPTISTFLATAALDYPQYHIAAIDNTFSSHYSSCDFDLLSLYPLDFEEFLWANSEFRLSQEIRSHFRSRTPMGKSLHQKALAQFYLYLAIGGMPLSILEYRKEKKLLMVPDVQQKLLNLFLEDITAHAPSNYTRYCRNCWQSIPAQIGKSNSKFQYRCIAKGATARLYQKPLQWRIDSGLACAVPRHSFSASSLVYSDSNTVSEIPNSGADSEFFYHIYFPDIGLCARQIHASSYLLLSGENNTAKHICTETFLAQHFFQNGYELSFWSGKNQAALPFLLKKDNLYIAIDYRLSPSQKQRNLARFKELYKDSQNLEFYLLSTEDFKQKEAYDIVPLYAGFCI